MAVVVGKDKPGDQRPIALNADSDELTEPILGVGRALTNPVGNGLVVAVNQIQRMCPGS